MLKNKGHPNIYIYALYVVHCIIIVYGMLYGHGIVFRTCMHGKVCCIGVYGMLFRMPSVMRYLDFTGCVGILLDARRSLCNTPDDPYVTRKIVPMQLSGRFPCKSPAYSHATRQTIPMKLTMQDTLHAYRQGTTHMQIAKKPPCKSPESSRDPSKLPRDPHATRQ